MSEALNNIPLHLEDDVQAPISAMWPISLALLRHAESEYDLLKIRKKKDPLYNQFEEEFDKNPESAETIALAGQVKKNFGFTFGEGDTPITPQGIQAAEETGFVLSDLFEVPDVVILSTDSRTSQTYNALLKGWPELAKSDIYKEFALRGRDHGLFSLYNDPKLFETFFPLQRELSNLLGRYRYVYPQGEGILDVRMRVLSWFDSMAREFAGARVFMVAHQLTVLALRTKLERLSEEQFEALDSFDKPLNCGMTLYEAKPDLKTRKSKLELQYYNRLFYSDIK